MSYRKMVPIAPAGKPLVDPRLSPFTAAVCPNFCNALRTFPLCQTDEKRNTLLQVRKRAEEGNLSKDRLHVDRDLR